MLLHVACATRYSYALICTYIYIRIATDFRIGQHIQQSRRRRKSDRSRHDLQLPHLKQLLFVQTWQAKVRRKCFRIAASPHYGLAWLHKRRKVSENLSMCPTFSAFQQIYNSSSNESQETDLPRFKHPELKRRKSCMCTLICSYRNEKQL